MAPDAGVSAFRFTYVTDPSMGSSSDIATTETALCPSVTVAAIIEQGMRVPFAFVRSEEWAAKPNDDVLRTLFENGRRDQYWQSISGTEHCDFVFSPLMSPVGGLIGIQGPIDSDRLISIIDDELTGFFGQHLLGEDRGFPESMETEYGDLASS